MPQEDLLTVSNEQMIGCRIGSSIDNTHDKDDSLNMSSFV